MKAPALAHGPVWTILTYGNDLEVRIPPIDALPPFRHMPVGVDEECMQHDCIRREHPLASPGFPVSSSPRGVHSQLHDNLAERAVEHTLRSRIPHRSFQIWSAVDSWCPIFMPSRLVVRFQQASRMAEVPKRITACVVVCSLPMVFNH